MNTQDIHQTVDFNCEPIELYNCIMNAKIHSTFTHHDAIIQDKVGGKFSAYDGYINGKSTELEKGKKIALLCRFEEEEWPEDYFSEIIFLFSQKGKKTHLDFYHKGVPEKYAKSLAVGWKDFYWKFLKEYLKK